MSWLSSLITEQETVNISPSIALGRRTAITPAVGLATKLWKSWGWMKARQKNIYQKLGGARRVDGRNLYITPDAADTEAVESRARPGLEGLKVCSIPFRPPL